jgi:hypothetical protein
MPVTTYGKRVPHHANVVDQIALYCEIFTFCTLLNVTEGMPVPFNSLMRPPFVSDSNWKVLPLASFVSTESNRTVARTSKPAGRIFPSVFMKCAVVIFIDGENFS